MQRRRRTHSGDRVCLLVAAVWFISPRTNVYLSCPLSSHTSHLLCPSPTPNPIPNSPVSSQRLELRRLNETATAAQESLSSETAPLRDKIARLEVRVVVLNFLLVFTFVFLSSSSSSFSSFSSSSSSSSAFLGVSFQSARMLGSSTPSPTCRPPSCCRR